jgi:hypothetical protein
MEYSNVRSKAFPYGTRQNSDGSWTVFNRSYQTLFTIADTGLPFDQSFLAKLDHTGQANGDRIYFYDDGSLPESSAAAMGDYLDKLSFLMALTCASEGEPNYLSAA